MIIKYLPASVDYQSITYHKSTFSELLSDQDYPVEPKALTMKTTTSISPFLRLPAELRIQIYSYVFSPDHDQDSEGDCLFPSSETIQSLGLLYTCRQIRHETLPFARPLFCRTNRWHRRDLEALRCGLDRLSPNLAAILIGHGQPQHKLLHQKTNHHHNQSHHLELATHLRLPFRDPPAAAAAAACASWTAAITNGRGTSLAFLDAAADHAAFVWDALAVFPALRFLTITVQDQQVRALAIGIGCSLRLDARAWREAKGLVLSPHPDSRDWRVEWDAHKRMRFLIIGVGEKEGRKVELVCRSLRDC